MAFSPTIPSRFRLHLEAIGFSLARDLGGELQPTGFAMGRRTVTRGMEFGVSPIPESRREMVDRGRLLDTPTFKWIPARGRLTGRILDFQVRLADADSGIAANGLQSLRIESGLLEDKDDLSLHRSFSHPRREPS